MSGTNFVGSKISLISKAGIRYLGTLVDINASESTVALENVVSFGTENRPCPTPYPPSKTTYNYIKFRGTDIADLHVFEQTQPQDPAIIEAQAAQGPPNGHLPGPIPPASEMSPGPHAGTTFNASFSPTSFNQPNNSGNFSAYPSQAAPTPANSFAESGDAPKIPSPAPARPVSQDAENKVSEAEDGSEHKGEPGNYRGRGRNNNQRKNSYNNRRYREGMPFTNKTLSFDADFDFESSNAKFNKTDIVEEFSKKLSKMSMNDQSEPIQTGVVNPNPDTAPPEETAEKTDKPAADVDDDQCYDRSKSFFDTISCEALEKEKGERRRPPSWHAERNLNSETFGEGVVSYHRRSYQNNYRGRGGMNNGGGYNNSSGYNNSYQAGQRYNNYNGSRNNEHNNSYYRGGYRNSGFRQHEGGYNRDMNRDNNSYNNNRRDYRDNGYNNREGGQGAQQQGGYNNRERAPNTYYSDRNNYQRRDNRDNRDNRDTRDTRDSRDNRNRNNYYSRGDEGQGRASYRRVERGGRQNTQTEAT